MQETNKRKVLPDNEEKKTEGYPWEMILLLSSLALGAILVGLKIVGLI